MRYWKIEKSISGVKTKSAFVIVLSFFVFCSASFQIQAGEITDFTHQIVQVVDRPKRIVTLAPSLGELAADLVGDQLDRIVGVSDYTDYPPGLTSVTRVGPYSHFNLEKVVLLKPDLVLATTDGNKKDQIDHLRELKVPVVVVNTESFDQIQESILLISRVLGNPEIGKRMVEQFKVGLARIRAKGGTTSSPRVMLQVGGDPLVVVGNRSFLHESLITVGATNVYAQSEAHYPKPSLEDVIQKNPDIIIVMALGGEEEMGLYRKMAEKWKAFENLKAVKNKQVHLLKSDSLLRPSLRLLEGLTQLRRVVHGEK